MNMAIQNHTRLFEMKRTIKKVFVKTNFDGSDIDEHLNFIVNKSPDLEIIILGMENCFQRLKDEGNIGTFIESCVKNIPNLREIHVMISFKISSWIDRLPREVWFKEAEIYATDGLVRRAIFIIESPKNMKITMKNSMIDADQWKMVKKSHNYPNKLSNIKSVAKIVVSNISFDTVENDGIIVGAYESGCWKQNSKIGPEVFFLIKNALLLEDMDKLCLKLCISNDIDTIDHIYSFFDVSDISINYSCSKLSISDAKMNFLTSNAIVKKLASLLPNLTKLILVMLGGNLESKLDLFKLFPRLSVVKIDCWSFFELEKICQIEFNIDLHLSFNIPFNFSGPILLKNRFPHTLSVFKLNSYSAMTPSEAEKLLHSIFNINHFLNKISVKVRIKFLDLKSLTKFFETTLLFLSKKASSVKLVIKECYAIPERIPDIISPNIINSLKESDTLYRLVARYVNNSISERRTSSYSLSNTSWSSVNHKHLNPCAKKAVFYILCYFKYMVGYLKIPKFILLQGILGMIKLGQFPKMSITKRLLPPAIQFSGNIDVQKVLIFLFCLKFLKLRVPSVIKNVIVMEFLLILDNRMILSNYLKTFPFFTNSKCNLKKRKGIFEN